MYFCHRINFHVFLAHILELLQLISATKLMCEMYYTLHNISINKTKDD